MFERNKHFNIIFRLCIRTWGFFFPMLLFSSAVKHELMQKRIFLFHHAWLLWCLECFHVTSRSLYHHYLLSLYHHCLMSFIAASFKWGCNGKVFQVSVACRAFTTSNKPGLSNIKLMLLSFCRLLLIVIADTMFLASQQNTQFIDLAI